MQLYDIVEIERDDEYNPQFIVEFELQKIIDRTSGLLDRFIDFMQKESPDILPQLLDQFKNKLAQYELIDISHVSFSYTPKNHDAFPDVFEQIRAVSLTLLNYPEYISTEKDGKISVPYWNYVRSYLIPFYLIASTMVEIMPREQAIELYKRSVDYETDQTQKVDGSITCVEDLYKVGVGTSSPTHTGTGFLTRNGVVGSKTTRCMWEDILQEFDDPELGYAVACHYDFNAARYINKNFRLTRTKTLMQGDEMCDFCWHDISIDTEMKHPPDSFWQELDEVDKNGSRP